MLSMFRTAILNLSKGFSSPGRKFSSGVLTTIRVNDGVKEIVMCHHKTRNALSLEMMQSLIENIKAEANNIDIRAVVISGEGPVFSAGHNLKELTEDSGKAQQVQVFNLAYELMNSILDSPVPIIAKVDGLAAAAGCQLVAQCDIAICTEKSTFSTPGASFGVFCSTPGVALARTVQKKTALNMLLTGLPISSAEAKSAGLVTTVCSSEDLDKEVKKVTDAIKSKSRSIVELGRKFFYEQVNLETKKAYEVGGMSMVQCLQLEDGKEGIKSFVEKRKPQWRHR